MNTIKKIAMIIVMENDLQVAVDFYKKLGLKLAFHVKDQWAEFKINDLQIGLCQTDEKINLSRTGIVFEVADINAFYETNKEALNFLDKPVEAAHGVMVSVQDPSGNILDLYQPTPEKIQALKEKLGMEDGCCGGKSCETENLPEQDACCQSEANQGGCC